VISLVSSIIYPSEPIQLASSNFVKIYMVENSARAAIIFATGMENSTISRQFAPEEEGTLIEYVLDSVWTVADELIVVFNHEPELSTVEGISPFGVKVLTTAKNHDAFQTICNAFKSAKAERCLLATERAPLLKPNVVLSLFENAQGHDLAIPKRPDGKLEPMLAVYRKNAFIRVANSTKFPASKKVEQQIGAVADRLFAVKYVTDDELRELDPELDSFLEVKDEKSLQKAREKASTRSKKILKQVK